MTSSVESPVEFIRRIKDSKEALQNLVNHLTVGESYFFRNRPHFDAVRNRILPELIENAKKRRTLRIWSAGCAKGEEPYSIAIVLHKYFPHVKDWEVIIQATDINTRFLEQAKQAVYPKWSIRGLDKALLEKYFTLSEGGLYRLDSNIISRVTFKTHNLNDLSHVDASKKKYWDLILCRNVLIYFSYEDYVRVVKVFEEALRPSGYLLLGHSEVLPQSSELEVSYSDATYYYRRDSKAKAIKRAESHKSNLSMPGIGIPSVFPTAPRKPVIDPVLPASSRLSNFSVPQPSQTAPRASEDTMERIDGAFEEAHHYANCGALDKAYEILHAMLQKSNPVDYHVHFLYAMVADQLGKSYQAQSSLKQVIFLNRKFVFGHFYLAAVFEREGNYKQAHKHYRNVWRLLEGVQDPVPVEGAEGLTVGRLREITEARLRETSL